MLLVKLIIISLLLSSITSILLVGILLAPSSLHRYMANKIISQINITKDRKVIPVYSYKIQDLVPSNRNRFIVGLIRYYNYKSLYCPGPSGIHMAAYTEHYCIFGENNKIELCSTKETTLIKNDKQDPQLLKMYNIIKIPKKLAYKDLPYEYKFMFTNYEFDSRSVIDGLKEFKILHKQFLIVPSNIIIQKTTVDF